MSGKPGPGLACSMTLTRLCSLGLPSAFSKGWLCIPGLKVSKLCSKPRNHPDFIFHFFSSVSHHGYIAPVGELENSGGGKGDMNEVPVSILGCIFLEYFSNLNIYLRGISQPLCHLTYLRCLAG